MADLLFILFGFRHFAYVALTQQFYLFGQFQTSQTGQSYSDTSPAKAVTTSLTETLVSLMG